jgi:hypothetical protein
VGGGLGPVEHRSPCPIRISCRQFQLLCLSSSFASIALMYRHGEIFSNFRDVSNWSSLNLYHASCYSLYVWVCSWKCPGLRNVVLNLGAGLSYFGFSWTDFLQGFGIWILDSSTF